MVLRYFLIRQIAVDRLPALRLRSTDHGRFSARASMRCRLGPWVASCEVASTTWVFVALAWVINHVSWESVRWSASSTMTRAPTGDFHRPLWSLAIPSAAARAVWL